MKTHTAELKLGPGPYGSVVVDGRDISNLISPDFTLTNARNSMPVLTVSFVGLTPEVVVEGLVELSPETVEALEALGWSRPE